MGSKNKTKMKLVANVPASITTDISLNVQWYLQTGEGDSRHH
jgi:hypothetical protein